MLKIYNSLQRKKENLNIKNKQKMNIYVCGPTVYDHLHIGNTRNLIFFDLLKRYLTTLGIQIYLVVNITDLDDKIIQVALSQKTTEKNISNKYTNYFFKLLKKLEIDLIDEFPLVTDNIKDIVLYVDELIKKGYAYSTKSGIYFRVHLIENYGILSKQVLNKLKKNVRKELDIEKENSEDFILWKRTEIGVKYPSPWFFGRPGWHTECVVLIKKIFKTTIDIHGGGSDLKFPHHENEIAQFFASDKKPLANFFMHIGQVNYQQQKMSKSTGNIIFTKDLLKKYEVNSIKLLFLSYHYSQPIDYSDDLIKFFEQKYNKLIFILNKNNFKIVFNKIKKSEIIDYYIQKFRSLMDNDFNTANVVTLIEELCKIINKSNDLIFLTKLQNTLLYLFNTLGIKIKLKEITIEKINLYQKWKKFLKEKNFQKADILRNILKKENIL
ncbi:cysteine--tRNA ligase [Candidatus Phytoplasma pini]|uniref:Cysteine--tRNA ligase n=1 Tax=Candidatus Phytoplasma pini TaxID=267362 RepID=A0A559KJJ4_9MOLU|nr:cysteine--tRNA ligase [Candidatus Phytoplasma pini]TVY12304.1 Cysteinyl-tRNA synthetase [Candidatus Phytoplasma pini]